MPASMPSWLNDTAAPAVQRLKKTLENPCSDAALEALAATAQALTRRHFGRTISLYAPLYLSNYCSGGCVYCGYAADREIPRHKLTLDQARVEMLALRTMGIEEILLLTGERTPRADYAYLRRHVDLAAGIFPSVAIETFPMSEEEYRGLVEAGCTSVTLYQETYDPARYEALHRWGDKADYLSRLEAPERALAAGIRHVGVGALLGLSEPVMEMIRLFNHVHRLRKKFWRAGVSVSFPRLRPQAGGYQAAYPVDERWLARLIFILRTLLPDTPLVLSTRETPAFRDGMAGVGISKMSVASRTTVGGYSDHEDKDPGQFDVSDARDVRAFCAMLREKGLEPVFKNWDMVYRH
ncbi:MAG: 2-iminoacetate synthase ThiH [Lentisphaeria bacterium]|nr:2-iminoacetate synthase ThiH [Lentisphaeria bacterium]